MLTPKKRQLVDFMNREARRRDAGVRRNRYYYRDLSTFLRYNIPKGRRVLEVGCGIGDMLAAVEPAYGVGIDISDEMVRVARDRHPQLTFKQMDVECLDLGETFDFVIISDTMGYLEDVQRALTQVHEVCTPRTRVIITVHNFVWQPMLVLAEALRLKMPQSRLNWLGLHDIAGILRLTDFEVVKKGTRFLFPRFCPVVSWLCNRFLVFLPGFRQFGIIAYTIAKPVVSKPGDSNEYSVTVVIPARNEKGNIEDAVRRLPVMGKHTEVIFVEGHSTDGTPEEIRRVCAAYRGAMDLKGTVQGGKGKADAVRKGFAMATGDILMILDADLTVAPEDLPKFYGALATGKGEFVNGTRLVYPLEKEAMRFLNLAGNKFFAVMFSWLLDQNIKDTLCGTKAIMRSRYEELIANRRYFGDFDPFGDFDLIFGAAKLNLKFLEVPIRYRAREYGSTSISRFRHGWLLIRMVCFAMNKIKFV